MAGKDRYRPGQNPDNIPGYILDIQRRLPRNWEDPKERVVRMCMEQSGLLPHMIHRNPVLSERITDFFVGDKSILVIGGESGMGKSLLNADLRKMHADLGYILPEQFQHDLAVITWDRTHKAFYEEASTAAGETISLPKGETPMMAREIVSSVMGDQVNFVRKYVGRDARIIIETPLIDNRGETIFDELVRFQPQVQTLVMHSSASRDMTLHEGRLMETSGQPDAMNAIRDKLLYRILGKSGDTLSVDEQDLIIKNWWMEKMRQWNGMIVEWDPNDDMKGYETSKALFLASGIKPDHLGPRALSYATRNQFESIFRAMQDVDGFLWTIMD